MTVDKYYRTILSLWVRIAGDMFPRLTRKIRATLADPDATEADYNDLIAEVNRAGGPRIGSGDIKWCGVETTIPLTGNEYAVLQQLARHRPQLIKITDLAADLECDRTAASEAVQDLEKLGHVERPRGDRSGIGITDRCFAVLRSCDRPSLD